jgi:hypothetical protein
MRGVPTHSKLVYIPSQKPHPRPLSLKKREGCLNIENWCIFLLKNLIPVPFYVVKQGSGDLFFLSLYGKSEEEVSSAGEQLTSNKIYDGENTREGLSKRKVFSF